MKGRYVGMRLIGHIAGGLLCVYLMKEGCWLTGQGTRLDRKGKAEGNEMTTNMDLI